MVEPKIALDRAPQLRQDRSDVTLDSQAGLFDFTATVFLLTISAPAWGRRTVATVDHEL